MKFVIAVAFFIMSVNTLDTVPQFDSTDINFRDERSVSSYIKQTIEDMSQYIKDAGFDPLYIDKLGQSYALPVPVLFNRAVLIEELSSNGMSNIVVNSVSYNFLSSRLNFDIELPLIDFSAGAASAEATFFGNTFKMNSTGKVEIQCMRFVGHIRININLISGISIRSTKINFTMGGIKPDATLVVQNEDYSDKLNEFLSSTLPAAFKAYSSEINELLEILLMDYMNQYLEALRN